MLIFNSKFSIQLTLVVIYLNSHSLIDTKSLGGQGCFLFIQRLPLSLVHQWTLPSFVPEVERLFADNESRRAISRSIFHLHFGTNKYTPSHPLCEHQKNKSNMRRKVHSIIRWKWRCGWFLDHFKGMK